MKFNRENRYLVAKIRDASKYLSELELVTLFNLLRRIDAGRRADGKASMDCVLVESDWPEYELVWSLIEARFNKNIIKDKVESLLKDD